MIVSTTYEEDMIETYLYLSEPVDIHVLRQKLGTKFAQSPLAHDTFSDSETVVEIDWTPSGDLVESDIWSSDGPYLDEVACWARLRISTHGSPLAALSPIYLLVEWLDAEDVPYRWFDPFQQKVNEWFDLYDIMSYYSAWETLSRFDSRKSFA